MFSELEDKRLAPKNKGHPYDDDLDDDDRSKDDDNDFDDDDEERMRLQIVGHVENERSESRKRGAKTCPNEISEALLWIQQGYMHQ